LLPAEGAKYAVASAERLVPGFDFYLMMPRSAVSARSAYLIHLVGSGSKLLDFLEGDCIDTNWSHHAGQFLGNNTVHEVINSFNGGMLCR
jgi:hypothetical protein